MDTKEVTFKTILELLEAILDSRKDKANIYTLNNLIEALEGSEDIKSYCFKEILEETPENLILDNLLGITWGLNRGVN